MITQIDHIGIAVTSLAEAIPVYEQMLGLSLHHEETVESQKVKVAFFKVGEVWIELLEATDKESPIAKFVASKGPGIHHVALKTDDIQHALSHAKGAGCKLINETPFDGAHGKEVAFLHPKSTLGVLFEFCMRKR